MPRVSQAITNRARTQTEPFPLCSSHALVSVGDFKRLKSPCWAQAKPWRFPGKLREKEHPYGRKGLKR